MALSIRVLGMLGLCALLFSGCEFKEIELNSVEQFNITSVNSGKMEGVLTVELTNPNIFPVTVKSGELDIFANRSKLGTAVLNKAFKISGNSTARYDIELTGTFGNLLSAGISGLAGMLTGKDPELQVKGTFEAGNFIYTKTIPVDVTSRVPLRV